MSASKKNQNIASEEQFKVILGLISDPIFITDLDGKILEVNQAGCEKLEKHRNEMINANIRDFHSGLSVKELKGHTKTKKSDKKIKFQFTLKQRNGEELDLEVNGDFISFNSVEAIVFLFRDGNSQFNNKDKQNTKSEKFPAPNEEYLALNEEYLALNEELNEANQSLSFINEQLELSEKKFRIAFKTSPDSININRISDGLYLEINEGFTRLTGYTEEDVKNKTSGDITIWDDPKDRQRLVNVLKDKGFIENMEARFRLKDGTIKTGLMSARIIEVNREKCILSVTRDISERVQIADKMHKQQQYLHSVIQTTRDGFWILDRKGNFLDVNEAYCTMAGYKKEEILKLSIIDIDAFEDAEKLQKRIERIIKNGHEIFETKHFRKDKSVFDAEISVSYLNTEGGQFICFCRDISERKSAEQEIIRMAAILDLAPSAITVHDFEGSFLYTNQKNLELHGYPKDELMKLKLNQIDVPESKALIDERIRLIKQKGEASFEVEHYRKNGSKIPLMLYVKSIDWKGVPAMLSIGTDITQLKKAESLIKESNERNKAILEALPDIMFVSNQEGVFLDYFAANVDDLIVHPDKFLNKNALDVLPPYLYEINKDALDKLFKTGEAQNYSYSTEIKGNIRYFDARMVKLGDYKAISIVRDITEKIKAEESLRFSEERLKFTMEATNDGLWDWNVKTDEAYFSPAYYTMLGFKPGGFPATGSTWEKLIHPEDKENALTVIEPCILGITDTIEVEFRLKTSDNKWRWILSRGKCIERDQKGRAIRIVGTHVDITQAKNLQEELIKAKEKAEESDHLKTAFLQNMSHEIRTPLNAISGFSGMLTKPDLSEEKRKSFTSIIRNSSNQLISIVTDILTISSLETKQEKLSIEKVCINSMILELLAIFKLQAINQNISLYAKQELNDKQSEIYTDKTKITQILTNLISNALKFTHEGFIEFGYMYGRDESSGTSKQQEMLKFYVKDTGIGIKPEFHKKIFERFRQADLSINRKYGGTGLGLSISKGFAKLLGGKIWVESEPDKGSTFYFTVPYNPTNEQVKTILPSKSSKPYKTVLVAEDEEYNYLFIEELLIDMDLKLIHAKNGQETVDICKTNTNIDLVLMDIKMPIMDGHTAAKLIKEFLPGLPIIAQSAYALEHEIEKYRGIFDDYITKPIDASILKEKINDYITK